MTGNPSSLTLAEIAEKVQGELVGSAEFVIRGAGPIHLAGPEEITFLEDPEFAPRLSECKAGAILLAKRTPEADGRATIIVDQPYSAFVDMLEFFHPRTRSEIGISPTASMADDAEVGDGTNVYPGAHLGRGVRVGENCEIHPGAFVGDGAVVGSDCILWANATVYHGCELGDRVILHSGAVIGADGFGYTQTRVPGNPMEPVIHRKIPQIGKVVLGDDVEVGANSTIDRATFEVTRIGRGTKIDNLVQIGHNCSVGVHTLIVSQAGVAGSTKLGNYVTLAGQVGVTGHIEIGDQVVVGAQGGVTKSIPAGSKLWGTPATDHRKWMRTIVAMAAGPETRKNVADLQRRIIELEKRLDAKD
jgi:UDP-3-O-[3-hydroxymyristoyl] glucosamine N-acyltransferase